MFDLCLKAYSEIQFVLFVKWLNKIAFGGFMQKRLHNSIDIADQIAVKTQNLPNYSINVHYISKKQLDVIKC